MSNYHTNLKAAATRVPVLASYAASIYSNEWGEGGRELSLTKQRWEDILGGPCGSLSLDEIVDLEQDGEISFGEYDALEQIIEKALDNYF